MTQPNTQQLPRDARWEQDGVTALPLPQGMSQISMRGGQQLAQPQPGDDVELYVDDGTGKDKGVWTGGFVALSNVEKGQVGGPYDGEDVVFVGKAGQDMAGESVEGDEWPADMLRLAKGAKTPFAPPDQRQPQHVASFAYDASETRDYHGRWSTTGGGGPTTTVAAPPAMPIMPRTPTRDELEAEWKSYSQAERMAMVAGTLTDPGLPGPNVNQRGAHWTDRGRARSDMMINHALDRGMTVAEYAKATREHVQELIDSAKIVKRTHMDTLTAILEAGRIQNQFEAGKSSGDMDNDLRAKTEAFLFGTHKDAAKGKRVIYGYLTDYPDDPNTDTNDGNDLNQYGNVDIVFKDALKARTTFLEGDSLGLGWYEDITHKTGGPVAPSNWPAPMSQPNLRAFMNHYADILDMDKIQNSQSEPYTEAQIHGPGPTLRDIDYVVLPDYSDYSESTRAKANKVIEALRKAGVRYVVRGAGTKSSFARTGGMVVPYALFAFDPTQIRGYHGRWVDEGRGPTGEGGRIPAPFMPGSKEEQAQAAQELFQAYGLTADVVRERMLELAHGATKETYQYGMTWYAKRRVWSQKEADPWGVGVWRIVGAIAATSPKTPWADDDLVLTKRDNQAIVQRLEKLVFDPNMYKTVQDITPELAQAFEDAQIEAGNKKKAEAIALGKTPRSYKVLSMRDYNGTDPAFAPHTNLIGKKKLEDLPADILIEVMAPFVGTLHDNAAKAIRILRGEDPATVLGGTGKTRSFYNNMLIPNDPTFVTIDVHMMRAMTNNIALSDKELGKIVENGSKYKVLRDGLVAAANAEGILPQQLQAIVWGAWQDKHGSVERRNLTLAGKTGMKRYEEEAKRKQNAEASN